MNTPKSYMALGEIFSRGARRVVSSGQDSSILPARVANHNAGFDSSSPLAELATALRAISLKNHTRKGPV